MLQGGKSAVRNGLDTLFWTNCWVDNGLQLIDFADTTKPEFDVDCTVADMTLEDGSWNLELIEDLLQPDLVDLVAGMPPPRHNRGEDDWIWGCERSGQFTIKSAYNLICQTEEIPDSAIWKAIWKWDGPSRIRHFLWLAAKDRLLTNASRKRRGMCQDGSCGTCNIGEEDAAHVLRDCPFAKEVWKGTSTELLREHNWQLPFSEWMEFYLKADSGLQFGIVCWFLWRSRNERIFAGGRDRPPAVAAKASSWLNTVREAMCREADLETESGRGRRSHQGRAAAGGVIRDSSGNCLQAFTMNLGRCSITRAEICGALEGVRRAWEAGHRKLEIQMDSKVAVGILLNRDPASSHQFTLEVLEFQEWLQREWTVELKHVYREANHAADYLANLGHNTTRGSHEVHHTDCNLAYFIRYDVMGVAEPRLIK
ncbi:Putative ribonuclease H protein At1g65750 [Linum perenne]